MPNIQKPNQHFDVITYTGNGKAVTVAGNAQISTAQSKFGGSSAYFDGTGDYLTLADSADFAFGAGDFTIEFWFRTTTVTGSTEIICKSSAGVGPFTIYRATTNLYFYASTNGTSWDIANQAVIGTCATNTWYHIAISRSGTSIKTFLDGALGSTTTSSASIAVNSNVLNIGYGANGYVKGYIDDLRIYKGVAKYTANFTAPTGALAIGPTDPYWQYCVLAMPMDGTNASTTFPTFAYNASTNSALSFQPDLVWIKGRSGATDHAIYDAVRGATKDLASNLASAEVTNLNGLANFNTNGFTVGNLAKVNTSAATYAAWCWKAGNSTSTNTAGTITSTVSVNPTAGFSVVTYDLQATGSKTVGHGLGSAPKMIIIKSRTSSGSQVQQWFVYHSSIGATKYVSLNQAIAESVNSTVWDDTNPTSTVFTVGSGFTSANYGVGQIAYCWAEVPGFSSFGSYTGNGNANGPFINLGFRPAFVMVKATSAAGNWLMYDKGRSPSNLSKQFLYANAANAETVDTTGIDILSNGFKHRNTYNDANLNAVTYIYMAFAENPFNYSLAR